MKIFTGLPVASVLILTACLALCVEGTTWASKGQGLNVVHRDDAGSPYYNPSAEKKDLLVSAIARSKARYESLNRKATQSPAAKICSANIHVRGKGPVGGPVSSPPSSGAGEYFVSVKLGTPGKEVLLAIDTGSEISWAQCTPCVVCYQQILPIYNPAKSSSYMSIGCQNPDCASNATNGGLLVCSEGDQSCAYEVEYGDGSITAGTLSKETFTFSSQHTRSAVAVRNLVFGCGRVNTGLFFGNSGLMGLDRGPFSFATQLKGVFGHKFTVCFTDRISMPNATSFLFFGETENMGLSYTPILSNPGGVDFYYVNFTGITVGNTTVPFDAAAVSLNTTDGSRGTIVDTGTTVTFLPDVVYTPFLAAFHKASYLQSSFNDALGLDCYNFTTYPPRNVPIVTFRLQGVELEFETDNLFIGPFDPQGHLYCFAFVNAGDVPGFPAVILGNWQQQDFHMEFDLQNSRIGFKKTNCAAR
jgi:hypothetical protein